MKVGENMIQIKPHIEHQAVCPECNNLVDPFKVLWQGIHTCAVCKCASCQTPFIEDFRVSHAMTAPFKINLASGQLFQLDGDEGYKSWFGIPLQMSIFRPKYNQNLEFQVEKRLEAKKVIIINCLHFLYGDALLRLLSVEFYLREKPEFNTIVLIPKILQWMVPDGVSEIWTINIPLAKMLNFYPQLDQFIYKECQRFDTIYLSKAHYQPHCPEIARYTGVEKHKYGKADFRITFIWRDDRVWCRANPYLHHKLDPELRRSGLQQQNSNICCFFEQLRLRFPNAKFTVAGLGVTTAFPEWIDDRRVEKYTDDLEQATCKIYGESRLVIGVHGSNMLLPSAHAGMTLDLIPDDRWGNLAQDTIYQDIDVRVAVHQYLYLPLSTDINLLVEIASNQLKKYDEQYKIGHTT